MLNVAQLTSQLAQMSDQALQQYAQMHKEDPYTLALSVTESNRRKALRQSAAAQQQPGATRPVAEQALEEMGIAAAVPEEAMEFAQGGIVGYADGGETLSPYQRALKEQQQRDREAARRTAEAVESGLQRWSAAGADIVSMPLRGAAGAIDTAAIRPLRALGLDLPYISPGLVPEGADVNSMTPYYDQLRSTEKAPVAIGNEGRRTPMGPLPAGIAAAAGAQPAAPSAPKLSPNNRATVDGATGAVSRGGAQNTGIAQGVRTKGYFDVDGTMREGREALEGIAEADRRALEGDQEDLEARIKARGVAGQEREARLKKQEAGLAGRERDAERMGFIQAGLAILAADPSRGGIAAIGEGALKGLGAYKGDMAALEAKREKINESMDQIAELRRQEAAADEDARAGIRSSIRKISGQTRRDMFSLYKDVGIPMKMKDVELTFQAAQKDKDRATQRAVAGAGASAQERLIQRYAQSKNIPFHQAVQEVSSGKRAGFDPREGYVDYLKGYKPDPLNPNAKAMSFAEFARMFPPDPVAAVPGQGATVRP